MTSSVLDMMEHDVLQDWLGTVVARYDRNAAKTCRVPNLPRSKQMKRCPRRTGDRQARLQRYLNVNPESLEQLPATYPAEKWDVALLPFR